MTDDRRNAELYLESCALGYAATVQAAVAAELLDCWLVSKSTLHDAGVRLAAALGNLDAAERAELTALRRFRDGVVALRGELSAGLTDADEPIAEPRERAVETLDALLLFESPSLTPAKEPT